MYLMEQNISAYLDLYQLLYFLHLFEHVQQIPVFPVLPMTVTIKLQLNCVQCLAFVLGNEGLGLGLM